MQDRHVMKTHIEKFRPPFTKKALVSKPYDSVHVQFLIRSLYLLYREQHQAMLVFKEFLLRTICIISDNF